MLWLNENTVCPSRYRNRHFFNRVPGWLADRCSVSHQLGALQTHTTDTFLFISHTTNVLLFKLRCNVFNAGFGSEWDTLYNFYVLTAIVPQTVDVRWFSAPSIHEIFRLFWRNVLSHLQDELIVSSRC